MREALESGPAAAQLSGSSAATSSAPDKTRTHCHDERRKRALKILAKSLRYRLMLMFLSRRGPGCEEYGALVARSSSSISDPHAESVFLQPGQQGSELPRLAAEWYDAR